MLDDLGRPVIPAGAKSQIAQALADIPAGKRGALILFATQDGATAQLAARIGSKGDWKVAGGVGTAWTGPKPQAWVSVSGAW